MDWLDKAIGKIRSAIAGSSGPTRALAVAMTMLAAAGGIWLAVSAADRPAGVSPGRPARSARPGQIPRPRMIESASVGEGPVRSGETTATGLAGPAVVRQPSEFDRAVGAGDMWRTEAQNAKCWLAAKMASLGRLISAFPDVESASVIVEPGRAGGLGRPAVRPSAAVSVSVRPSARMTARLAGAIVDLVCGSVAGMQGDDVRIVDSAGRSCRPLATGGVEKLEALEAIEAHHADKIRRALHYIPGLSVSVQLDPSSQPARCKAVSVLVPRSYITSIVGNSADEGEFARAAQAQLGKIRRATAAVAGLAEADWVHADWYHDGTGAAGDDLASARGGSDAWLGRYWAIPAGAAAALATLATWAAMAWGRSRRRQLMRYKRYRADRSAAMQVTAQPTAERALDDEDRPLAFLCNVPEEDLLAMLEHEHPQMVAVVLCNLPVAKAGAILASLPSALQVDVARRVAAFDQTEPEVLRQAEQRLAAEFAAVVGSSGLHSGAAALAGILRHAGYAAEKRVLHDLSRQEPSLVSSVRRQIFVFEDVVDVPPPLLRAAVEPLGREEVAIALRAAGEQLKTKILKSLPSATAKDVRRQMGRIGPVRLSDVEAAQRRVVEAVRRIDGGRYVSAEGASAVTPGRGGRA